MASQLGKRSRQRSKKFYGAKKQKVGGLEPLSAGMQGVLITTSDQEKLCVSEAYSLLNEYGDKLYGPEHLSSPEDSDTDNDEASDQNDGSVDMETEVAKEIERLKGGKGKDGKTRRRRFQVVDTGAKHVVFIRCLEEVDPCQLVHHMLSDIATTGVRKSRFCQRILPVTKVCHASVKDIQRQADSVLQPHFHMDSLIIHKFAVNYKARNNNGVNRDEIIKLVASMVIKNGDFDHKVDLNNPDLTIVVEIIKNLCCLSVIKDFVKLKKYNLQSLVPPDPQKSNRPSTSSEKTAAVNVCEKAASNSRTTTVNPTDSSDCKDTADRTDTGDQSATVCITDAASDKSMCTKGGVGDEVVSTRDEIASGDSNVAESVEQLGTEPSSSAVCTDQEIPLVTHAGTEDKESIKTGAQKEENNEN